ncbi:MAG TPA: DUF1080 domain-containing protein [Ramlibacter sp.]|jgi:hypothetical protein|uniref:3-keto-disaccharide hydrolase n=1 Tax=Ramlibacter sp. TaxID=1917967 RepID=UPI002D46D61F|nr:DUF1080 domain-containing protein [Ramlibacter sp.]HZY17541.1 DUF1080 domain-containing protein [Ramlibacter sp.]
MITLQWTRRLALGAAVAALAGCTSLGGSAGWTTLVGDGRGLENFNQVGQADWAMVDGVLQATRGGKEASYLVTRVPYKDFMVRAEFWASDDANSGLYLRCQNPAQITDENCYEANIFDQRPDPTYATGALVKVAPVRQPAPRAGGKWNTYEITMQGDHLVLVLNGEKTVDVRNTKLASGPLALQWARGTVKFRKVEIRPL